MENWETKTPEQQVQYISEALETLNMGMRTLDKAAGVKVDTTRNFLRGRSRIWRGDNQNKILSTLARKLAEKNGAPIKEAPSAPANNDDDEDNAFLDALKIVFKTLINDKRPTREQLDDILATQEKKYMKNGLEKGAPLFFALRQSLHTASRDPEPPARKQSLQHVPAESAD